MVPIDKQFTVQTTRRIEAIDVTDRFTELPIADGLVWVSSPHTTVGLLIGEADPDMLADYERFAAELVRPFEPFRHHRNNKPNAAAHIVSSLVGTSVLLPVSAGRLDLGTFQRIVLLELDGPHPARIVRSIRMPIATDTAEG